jgi:hypothetical protein
MPVDAGWRRDERDPSIERWFDGRSWTALTRHIDSLGEPDRTLSTTTTSVPAAPRTTGAGPDDHPTIQFRPEPPSSHAAPVRKPWRRPTLVIGALLGTTLAVVAILLLRANGNEPALRSTHGGQGRSAVVGTSPATTVTATATTASATTASPTTTGSPRPTGPTIRLTPAAVSASSIRVAVRHAACSGERVTYEPGRAFDGDPDTGWAARQGSNDGEWIEADFATPVELREVRLFNGYVKISQRTAVGCRLTSSYDYNRHIVRIAIEAGGETREYNLLESAALQTISLASPVITRSVRVRVVDTVLPAGADDDTVISEIELRGAT